MGLQTPTPTGTGSGKLEDWRTGRLENWKTGELVTVPSAGIVHATVPKGTVADIIQYEQIHSRSSYISTQCNLFQFHSI